jgi:polyhydroxyalkanoate synthesis regulator phasin
MSDRSEQQGEPGRPSPDGVAEAVRSAVERTMRATAGSAAGTRGRAADLVDDVVRRGREARDELARRGQEAGAGLARRGHQATGEVGRRLEQLERRLAELESRLAEPRVEVEGEESADTESRVED